MHRRNALLAAGLFLIATGIWPAAGQAETASAVASIKLSWKFPDRMANMHPSKHLFANCSAPRLPQLPLQPEIDQAVGWLRDA